MSGRQQLTLDKNLTREKNWNQRFILDKIPKFDAYNDVNYLSLGLLKSKIRYEERIRKEEGKSRYAGRIYSAHYTKPKSSTKTKKDNNIYQNYLKNNNKKERYSSMRISVEPNNTKNINKHKTINNFHYQGTLTSQNLAGSYTFNYMPDYKNKNINYNFINIISEEDPEIAEEYELVRDLWEKLGVTNNYVRHFDYMLNSKGNNRDSILELIIGEKKQMKKFRLELMKVISEVNKRENKINDLKQFIKTYEQINDLIKIKEEKKDEKKAKNIGEVNKELIENDIHDCLKSLRLRTINAVNIIKKFKTSYYHLFNNKINLEFIKNKYGFNDKYLSKIKNDLDFLKNSAINTLYNFSEKGGDPFLLQISDKCGNPSDVPKYKQLPISNEILAVVKNFKFSLEQEEVFTLINNKNTPNKHNYSNIPNKNNKNTEPYNKNNNIVFNQKINNYYQINDKNINNFIKSTVNENLISANFKGNVENEKIKLKAQNEYKNVFYNTEDNYDDFQGVIMNKEMPKEEKKYELPGMTSKQLRRHLDKYNKIKRELYPPFNKDLIKEEVQKNIIQKIEDRMNKVEKEFRTKMDEQYKKEEQKIREEEMRIKIEKEKIEKLRIEEEEERKKKEEKYLKFEQERNKRKNKDKKKKEENERFIKRENDIFLREMQMKFMKEVDERFRKENDREIEIKREEIDEAEEMDKERKEEIERIRNEEYEEIKRGDVLVDLRNEEDRVKVGSDINSATSEHKENSVANTHNKKSDKGGDSNEKENNEESVKESVDKSSKKESASRGTEKKKTEKSNENESGSDNDDKKDKEDKEDEDDESKKKDETEENKSKTGTSKKNNDELSEDIQFEKDN